MNASALSNARAYKMVAPVDVVQLDWLDSTIVFARPWKATSTLSPVFADV